MRYTPTIKELPLEERPRERLIKYGPEALSNVELLAIMLRTGTQRESALALAETLLQKLGNLRAVAAATPAQLSNIPGIGQAKAAQIKAAFELGKRLSSFTDELRPVVKSPLDAANLLMEDLRYQEKEYFKALYLNAKNQVIKIETVSIGSLSENIVHPREVFKPAISYSSASVLVAHNHPSGDLTPSQDDINITKRLIETGKTIGIDLLDHLIIAGSGFLSLREKGLI